MAGVALLCQLCSPALFSVPDLMDFWPHSTLLRFTKQNIFTLGFVGLVSSGRGEEGKTKVLKSRTSFLEHQWLIGLTQLYHLSSHLLKLLSISWNCKIFPVLEKGCSAHSWDAHLGKMRHGLSSLAMYFPLDFSFKIILSSFQLCTCHIQ